MLGNDPHFLRVMETLGTLFWGGPPFCLVHRHSLGFQGVGWSIRGVFQGFQNTFGGAPNTVGPLLLRCGVNINPETSISQEYVLFSPLGFKGITIAHLSERPQTGAVKKQPRTDTPMLTNTFSFCQVFFCFYQVLHGNNSGYRI